MRHEETFLLPALSGIVALAVLGGRALTAADKDTVQVPGGLAMSEFKGYEDWAVVATSETNELMKVMVANPAMIAAYKSGIPLNGKHVPGRRHHRQDRVDEKKKNLEAPFDVQIPNTLKDVLFITKDSKRFAGSAGWGTPSSTTTLPPARSAPKEAAAIAGMPAIRS